MRLEEPLPELGRRMKGPVVREVRVNKEPGGEERDKLRITFAGAGWSSSRMNDESSE